MATAVLCTVDLDDAGVVLRWSNAGHPPPLLLLPAGPAELLYTRPELLLGLDPGTVRTDHCVALPPGSFVVLYTDGLVERRGEGPDDSLARLQQVATALQARDVEALADALLDRLAVAPEDDVALVVLGVPSPPPMGPPAG